MIIDQLVGATRIQSGFGVTIDGLNLSSYFGPDWSTTHDSEAAFASCSLPVLQPFTLASGRHTIALYTGWQGTYQPVFTGEITNRADTYYPVRSTLQAGGYLRRLQAGLDLEIAFCNTAMSDEDIADQVPADFEVVRVDTDAALIVHILERYGITPETTGHSIDASWWTPAVLSPILWDTGKSGWSIIQEIDKIADYRTADGRLGQVLRRQLFGTVPGSVRHTFQQGKDILDLSISTEFEVYNQVKVTGAAIVSLDESDPDNAEVAAIAPGGTPTPSSYIPDPPGVRTDDSIHSDYIETVEDAAEVAGRLLARLQEPLQDVQLTTFGCPELDIGDGIGVSSSALNLSSSAFVVAHTVSGSPLRSELRVRAGTAGSGTRPNQPPTAQMIITVVIERILIDGASTVAAMITIDARASSDSDGTIASWSIAVDGATYIGADISTAVITHLSTSASPLPITLTVTDDGGLATTLTQSATWDPATSLVEPLTLAESTQGEATADGESTWAALDAGVTAVAPIALGGTTCYGCADGTIYRSIDMLASPATLAQTLPAAVNCLWCNEQATSRWLAGLDNGEVWISIDDGLTFTKLHTFDAAVNDLSESPAQPGEMTACSGPSLWHTYDNGASWQALLSGTGTALRFAAGHVDGQDQAFVGFDDGTVQSTGGVSFTLPTPAAIRGMTLSLDATELYIFTDSTVAYVWTPAAGVATGPATGTAANRAIRSGSGQWVYVATDGALQKWIARQAAYDVRLMSSPQRALSVGYGSVGTPAAPPPPPGTVEVLRGTWNSIPGGVWHFVPGSGWILKNNGLPQVENIAWTHVAASPHNPDHWLVLGQAADAITGRQNVGVNGPVIARGVDVPSLWITTDAGATWNAPTVPYPVDAVAFNAMWSAEWSTTTAGRWYITGAAIVGEEQQFFVGSGDLLVGRPEWHDEDYYVWGNWMTVGPQDDLLIGHNAGPIEPGLLYWRQSDHVYPSVEYVVLPVVPTPRGPDAVWPDVEPGGRAAVALDGFLSDGTTFWRTSDYHSAPLKAIQLTPPLVDTFGARTVAATINGVYLAGAGGIMHVTNFVESQYTWSATATLVPISEGYHCSSIRSDRQTKTALIAPEGDSGTMLTFDGLSWQQLQPPEGTTSVYQYSIEVIKRVTP